MHSTISQMFYPDRQAFFERLTMNLSLNPAIKIGPAPLPDGKRRWGSWKLRKAVPTETLSTAQRSMKIKRKCQRDQSHRNGSREVHRT